LQNIADLAPFNGELMFVIDVLKRAAAAAAEIWARWRNAVRRTFLHVDQLRFGELFFLAHDLGRNGFVLDRVRDKDSFALFPRDALPAERDVLDFKIDNAQRRMLARQIAHAT
jgi:hypothetical protein